MNIFLILSLALIFCFSLSNSIEDDVISLLGVKNSLSDLTNKLSSWTFTNSSITSTCKLHGSTTDANVHCSTLISPLLHADISTTPRRSLHRVETERENRRLRNERGVTVWLKEERERRDILIKLALWHVLRACDETFFLVVLFCRKKLCFFIIYIYIYVYIIFILKI